MQNKPSNDQHKSIYYRLRRSDPHERLSARLRHFSFGAAVFFEWRLRASSPTACITSR